MIPIKNIYHILSYVFYELQKKGYEKLETEEFDNIMELFAQILIVGINNLLKRGINKNYHNHTEQLSTIRGKIDLTKSINPFLKHKQVICDYDEFTHNTYKNRIIKTTIVHLIRNDISKNRKKKLKRILYYFNEVDILDIHNINWKLRYNRNNQTYRMIINICYLVISGLIQKEEKGITKLITLDDTNMPRLYEKFILEYFKREHPEVNARASYIKWQLDDDYDLMLPVMKSDITLSQENNVLIIDAKYYQHSLQENYDNKSIHSNNLYQIFTYVKNKEVELKDMEHSVSGMLLYAKTDEDDFPENTYSMSGNKISAKTLDLNVEFEEIKKQLDMIIEELF